MDAKLLDGIVATDNGTWFSVEDRFNVPYALAKTIHIKGITTATLHVCGSCEPTKPIDTDHGIQIGDDVTADCLVEINHSIKFIKVRCSAWTTGTISAYLYWR